VHQRLLLVGKLFGDAAHSDLNPFIQAANAAINCRNAILDSTQRASASMTVMELR
jgi:hypothetical protein